MAGLERKTVKVYAELDELMQDYIKMLGGFDTIKEMDEDTFRTFKKALKLIDEAKDLEVAKATAMDRLESKIDRLLTK